MPATLRFGLIGTGKHGIRYARHLARGDVPGATLAALCRHDAARGAALAQELGARFEGDPAALAASVDAVVVALPGALHHPVALAVAQAGRPLLLEKPMAATVAEAEAVTRAFEAAGVPLTVAHTLRFDPLVLALREACARLGPARSFGFEQRIEPSGLDWQDQRARGGGGVVLQTAIHCVDALRFVTGAEAVDVEAAVLDRVLTRELEDHAFLVLRARGGGAGPGACGDVRVAKVGTWRLHRYALLFEQAAVEADFIRRALIETRGNRPEPREVPEVPTVVAILRAFAAHVRGEAPNPVPARDALESLRVIEAAYQSASWSS